MYELDASQIRHATTEVVVVDALIIPDDISEDDYLNGNVDSIKGEYHREQHILFVNGKRVQFTILD